MNRENFYPSIWHLVTDQFKMMVHPHKRFDGSKGWWQLHHLLLVCREHNTVTLLKEINHLSRFWLRGKANNFKV